MEPENNIELVVSAFHNQNTKEDCKKLIVAGNINSTFGRYISETYHNNIGYLGAIYQEEDLNNLRHHSLYYFHGHSVRGTNPSLLEAMACQCQIIAHDNPFNQEVFKQGAYYFEDCKTIARLLAQPALDSEQKVPQNLQKIKNQYSFYQVHRQLSIIDTSEFECRIWLNISNKPHYHFLLGSF